MKRLFVMCVCIIFLFGFHFGKEGYEVSSESPRSGSFIVSFSIDESPSITTFITPGCQKFSYFKNLKETFIESMAKGHPETLTCRTSLMVDGDTHYEIKMVNPVYEEVSLPYPFLVSRGVIYRNQPIDISSNQHSPTP